MKKLFKGTIPTIALLLVAVMSLTNFTYAWFTAGDTATVDTVDVDVKSVDGLLVSANGYNGTWGSSLTPLYTDNSGNTYSAQKLRDVSCAGTLSTTNSNGANDLLFYTVEYNNVFDAITSSTAATRDGASDTDNWIQFNVYMKNEGTSAITVDLSGSTVTGSALSRAVARIALVQQGTASATAVYNTDTEPTMTYSPTVLGIWEPNATEHTTDGQTWLNNNGQSTNTTAKATYKAVNAALTKVNDTYVNVATDDKYTIVGTNLTANPDNGEYSSSSLPLGTYYVYTANSDSAAGEHFTALTIDSFFKPITVTDAIDSDGTAKKDTVYTYDSANKTYNLVADDAQIQQSGTYYQIATVGTASADVKAYTKDTANLLSDVTTKNVSDTFAAGDFTFTVPAQTIIKITVYIWVEGQDCDCTNYVAGNPFKVNLVFKKQS